MTWKPSCSFEPLDSACASEEETMCREGGFEREVRRERGRERERPGWVGLQDGHGFAVLPQHCSFMYRS